MPRTYEVLAPIYDRLGMADFAQRVTPRLINFAQQNDWLGRRIIDLGCGTGGSAVGLCQSGFTVTGVDSSAEMLQILERKLDDKSRPLFRPYQQDIAAPDNLGQADIVLAIDVMNEMESLPELEKVFNNAKSLLATGKLLIFDMHTVEGLTRRGQSSDFITQTGDFIVITHDVYDYERQIESRRFLAFHRQGDLWKMEEASRVLRAYPIGGVTGLLRRVGFSIMNVLSQDFEIIEPGGSTGTRVIFIAQKQ